MAAHEVPPTSEWLERTCSFTAQAADLRHGLRFCGTGCSAGEVRQRSKSGVDPRSRHPTSRPPPSYRSSGVRPVRLAILASMRGPISIPSWNDQT